MARAAGDSRHYRLAIIDGLGQARPAPLFEFVSVSTISGLLKDPNPLMGWAYNVATEGAKDLAERGFDLRAFDLEQVRALFKEYGHTPWKKKGAAAARGSEVHDYFEACQRDPAYLASVGVDPATLNAASNAIKTPAEMRESIAPELHGYLDAVDAWIEQEKPRPIFLERPVVSLDHRFAGTLDMLAERHAGNGCSDRLTDLKTSKGIYDSQFVQNSGYRIALREEGVVVDEMSILRVAADGTFEERVGDAPDETFLTLLRLYHLTQGKGH